MPKAVAKPTRARRARHPVPPPVPTNEPAPRSAGPFIDPAELPAQYALIAYGTCMLPEISDGANCAFSTKEKPQPGDLVALWYRPELVPAGQPQVRLKRLVTAIPSFVTFPYREHPLSEAHALVIVEQLNPRTRFGVRCADLLAVHKFIGLAESTRPGFARVRQPAGEASHA